MQDNGSPVPIICAHSSAVRAFELFNPNDWKGKTRGVVASCSTELAVLLHAATRISEICRAPMEKCREAFDGLRQQWMISPWDLAECTYFVQVPELHLFIEGFFAGLKSMLDLIVQVLTTEAVVGGRIDGFHKAGTVYGGNVLNALEHNVSPGKKQQAGAITELIGNHKQLWIDEAVAARHLLVHPTRGAHQLMFQLELTSGSDGRLRCRTALAPQVHGVPIDCYCNGRIDDITDFARAFLLHLSAGGSK